MLSRKINAAVIVFFSLLLSACASFSDDEEVRSEFYVHAPKPLGNIEYHTAILADELFASLRADKGYRYAVASFVPVTSLSYNENHQHPLMLLGHQLEQGLMTEASRRGFITQDYKITNDIIISDHAESVMSRDIDKLSVNQRVDFFISGTVTEQQEGAIVNARIIHVQSKDVVAAATKFFPSELFWEREKVTSRNGRIYRTGSY